MSEENEKYAVLNHRDQPVELHLESRVIVLPPYGRAEIEAAERDAPQIQAFSRAGLLTVQESETAQQEETTEPSSPQAAATQTATGETDDTGAAATTESATDTAESTGTGGASETTEKSGKTKTGKQK